MHNFEVIVSENIPEGCLPYENTFGEAILLIRDILMYLKIKNKDPRNVVILLTIMSKIYKSTKKKPKFNTHGVRLKQINIFGIW